MSDATPPSLTKICRNCGLDKPLSAFLELSGEHAGTYGNICGVCRKTDMEKHKGKDKGGSSRTDTGHKIDSKTKVARDIDHQETFERIEEEYYEEREEDEVIESKETEKKETRKKDERKHRESFLDRRRTQADKKHAEKQAKTHHQAQEETKQAHNAKTSAREEARKNEIDFTNPMIDTQIPKEKFTRGLAIRQFATLIGKSSPIGKMLGGKEPAKPNKDQTLSDYVEKTWGPKKR